MYRPELLLGTEAPVMMPSGADLAFFLAECGLAWCAPHSSVSTAALAMQVCYCIVTINACAIFNMCNALYVYLLAL